MAKYHVNSHGEPGKCSARKGGCPFGSAEEHFDNAEDARRVYETKMKDGNVPTSIAKEVQSVVRIEKNMNELKKNDGVLSKKSPSKQELDEATELLVSVRNDLNNNMAESLEKVKDLQAYNDELRNKNNKILKLKRLINDHSVRKNPDRWRILEDRMGYAEQGLKTTENILENIKNGDADEEFRVEIREECAVRARQLKNELSINEKSKNARMMTYSPRGYVQVKDNDPSRIKHLRAIDLRSDELRERLERFNDENIDKTISQRLKDRKQSEERMAKSRVESYKRYVEEKEGEFERARNQDVEVVKELRSQMRKEKQKIKTLGAPPEVTKQDHEIAEAYIKNSYEIEQATNQLLEKDLSDENLRKIVKSNQPKVYSYGSLPYERIYDHKNALIGTKKIAAEKSETVRRVKKMEDLTKKHGDLFLNTTVANSGRTETPSGRYRGHRISTVQFDREKLQRIGMEPADVSIMMRRRGVVGQSTSYNPKTGVYRVEVDSTD